MTRITGILVLLIGLIFAALGALGAHQATERADLLLAMSLQAGRPFNACDWARHWCLASIAISIDGVLLATAGTAMTLRKRWGLLVLAFATCLPTALDWAFKAAGMLKYAYEQPGWIETIVLLAIAAGAIYAFIRSSQTSAFERPRSES